MKYWGLLLLFFLLLPTSLGAQDGQAHINIITDSGISLIIFPEFPGPNQSVMARLEASTVDLDKSIITWNLNGTIQKKALGEKVFSFKTGNIGTRVTLTATIEASGGTFNKGVVFDVGSVDLLWQGTGYTPPFYKGRSLWGNQNFLTVTALPQVKGDARALIYRWRVNGSVQAMSSGVGKNSITLSDSLLGNRKVIEVDVLNGQDSVLATASLSLTPENPRLLVYELNPLYGYLFQREVSGKYAMKESEVTFAAFPLFFSTANRSDGGLSYEWRTNAGALESRSISTYRAPEDSTGSSKVNLVVRNLNKVTQYASKNFEVTFSKTSPL